MIYKETIFKIYFGIWRIRIWLDEDLEISLSRFGIKSLIEDQLRDGLPKEIAEWLCTSFPINAVEIIDNQGEGLVYYNDWP